MITGTFRARPTYWFMVSRKILGGGLLKVTQIKFNIHWQMHKDVLVLYQWKTPYMIQRKISMWPWCGWHKSPPYLHSHPDIKLFPSWPRIISTTAQSKISETITTNHPKNNCICVILKQCLLIRSKKKTSCMHSYSIAILRDPCWYVENVPFASSQLVNRRWPAKQIHKIHKIPAVAVSFVHKHPNLL